MPLSDQILSVALAAMILMEALAVLIFAAVALAEYIYPPEEVKKGRPK
jgi:hypothetical protein